MSKNFSLQQLSRFLADNLKKITAVHGELEEIQVGFNSAYVEWKAEHDATLERLTEAATERPEEIGPALQTRVDERVVEERRSIDERRQELRDKLIPETRSEADEALSKGKRLIEKLRQLNPSLDKREEKLKAGREVLEEELTQFNDQIRGLSSCLGVVINFIKINKLDRRRQRVIGKLEAVQRELKEVREEWQKTHTQIQDEQETLQAQWQELTFNLAQLQGELNYLDEEVSREALARRRAVRFVIDDLKEPVACPDGDLKQELDSMVTVNVQTDDYQEGLGSVSGLMSVLEGIMKGMERFDESVNGLISEQKMHSSYLSKLNVSLPEEVLAYHKQWDGLRQKVRDDGIHCANPVKFVTAVRPVVEGDLSEASIKAMFDGLGQALNRATHKWKG